MEVRARCPENEDLARFIWEKREALVSKDGYKEKLDATISKAYRNVCECKHPISSLRDASQVNGIGQWMLKQLKEFFPEPASSQQQLQEASPKAKDKGKKRYVPQKSSAPYAILLTLYKALKNGKEYMKKQEIIDAADASGLSRMSIQPNKSAGPSGQFGYGTKDWYSGWTTMKTLVSKGLVVKSSCPAKYMLTEEGISTAEECLQRSGMHIDSINTSFGNGLKKCSSTTPSAIEEDSPSATNSTFQKSRNSPIKAVPQYRGNTLNCNSKKSAYAQDLDDLSSDSEDATWHNKSISKENVLEDATEEAANSGSNSGWLNLPPLKFGETFLSAYCVVLLLDDRERFMNDGKGNSRDKVAEQLRCQFQIEVETRHLPIGDTLWIARHKISREEYVLDFIIERKKVSDLLHSIRDTRYKQQKLRLLRCGLRKLIYVVEGDPNVMDSAESIKTACFTTEIAEGFDVQRTQDVRDTMRKYGHLTHAISTFYNDLSSHKKDKQGVCRTYRQFIDDCKDLEKEKVSDVFGVMLMQVKQVTENIALSILQRYPTPLSLVSAYSRLKGDERAQENLLKGIPIINQNKEISSVVSKKIFQFICSHDTI